jgi:hypothetical protein
LTASLASVLSLKAMASCDTSFASRAEESSNEGAGAESSERPAIALSALRSEGIVFCNAGFAGELLDEHIEINLSAELAFVLGLDGVASGRAEESPDKVAIESPVEGFALVLELEEVALSEVSFAS